MIKISTGLASAVLGNYGLSAMMEHGVIDLYTGAQPVQANVAPTGTHVGRVTKGGGVFNRGSIVNGLTLDKSQPGVLRDTGDWIVTPMADGEVGWWRWSWYQDDPGTTDPFYPRLDGVIGENLVLSDPVMTTGRAPFAIDQFFLMFKV